jgi:hypothetical protein
MTSIAWKFVAALSVAGLFALAATPADARRARTARSTVSSQAVHAPSPSFRGSYNRFGGMSGGGGGINFNDGRLGANYRPGQG